MPVTFQFQINSLDMSSIVSEFEQTVVWKNDPQRIPRRHGARMGKTARLSERRFAIFGGVHETNAQSLQIATDSLQALLFGAEGSQVKLRKLSDRHILVQPTNLTLRAISSRGDWASEEIQGELIAEDPRWISDTSYQSAVSNTQSNNFTVVNTGTALTPPQITVTARSTNEVTQFRISNDTTGIEFAYTSVISRSTAVVVNVASLTLQNSGTFDLGNFIGGFWELQNGSNSITFSSSGNCDVAVDYNPRFY